MLTIKEVIKVFYNALMQKLKSHRGNWDQNDPNADDYIKNRPFYTDDMTSVVIIPKTSAIIGYERDAIPGGVITYSPIVELVAGESYTVIWDGKEYKCIAKIINGITAIGNETMIGGTNTGEPFFIAVSEQMFNGAYISSDSLGTHTVEVTTVKVVKLDKRYLPDLGLANVAYSGNYYDLNNTPSIYTDVVRYSTTQSLSTSQKTRARSNIDAAVSSHTHNASTITAGTFAGQVVANASAQSSNTSLLRNSRLVSTEATPSNNGEIYWMYE